ncbi:MULTISPECIES: helix-turn-helix transcriptional regulator [unclassified Ensifer]|uniref:helix-turn-helix domain-containing protein n=1 Tax=unclassified Ensifer TaxID=2633371 RepID=UPI000709C1B8|nr:MULTISPECIES: helix-turn-helix transcriptional regulator [unclassified Ensifer]KRD72305.1 XRE family transcriptional regulator [Ensifer sp. Root278]MBV7522467.1 helix-turn-helix domain-containing protein [Ensifer sp. ENS12]
MHIRQTIGWNLRRLRVAKGLSQEKLALEASIDRSYVGRIERGLENVTISALEALANVLEAKVVELFADVEPNSSRPPPMRSGRKPKS